MTWLTFIYWLSGLYTLYYLANMGWDLLRSKKVKGPTVQELSFAEEVQPQEVRVDAQPKPKLPEKAQPPVFESGGVRLKQLFQLAKAESIVYTGAVSY